MINTQSNFVMEHHSPSTTPSKYMVSLLRATPPHKHKPVVRILHLEDDMVDAELIRMKLNIADLPNQITRVQTRDEFSAALQNGHFDLVLADYHLPTYDGVSAFHLAQEKCPRLPFIFVSGAMREKTAIQQLAQGATDYVCKEDLSQLAPAIEHALEHVNPITVEPTPDQLQLSTENFNTIFQAIPTMVFITQLSNREYINANRAFCLATEFAWTELIGCPIDSTTLLDHSQVEWAFNKLHHEGNFSNLETQFRSKSGAVKTGRFSAQVIQINDSDCALWMGEDISEFRQSEQQLYRQVAQLRAQALIQQTVTNSLDLKLALDVFLTQVTLQLGVDAADVLILNPRTHMLEFAASTGFRGNVSKQARRELSKGYANPMVLDRQIIHVSDLNQTQDPYEQPTWIAGENFVSYWRVPLITKSQVCGILQIFHRTALHHDAEWLTSLESFAHQAAISIDLIQRYEQSQHAHAESEFAFDTLVTGWSAALDRRYLDTEGHTRRVTEKTIKLARKFGLSEDELVHIRRGALLHDIGKMNIPDHILLKPGPLNDEELSAMRQHPVYAYELLRRIEFLQPALDIPYCHHEKWDGTGYPRGLKGKEIPLVARIFALIDVWDALTSDRPYRAAWDKTAALEFIRQQAGAHFDPQLIPIFIKFILQESLIAEHT